MSSTLLPCPFCGGEVKIDMLDSENSRNVKIYSAVHCPKCHEWFFKGLSKEKTVAAWNRRTQPENKPLTLDELRQMDGEPVYIAEEKLWVIIKCEQTGRWAGMPFAVGQTHGINFEWNIKKRGLKCYRYKPKEETQ